MPVPRFKAAFGKQLKNEALAIRTEVIKPARVPSPLKGVGDDIAASRSNCVCYRVDAFQMKRATTRDCPYKGPRKSIISMSDHPPTPFKGDGVRAKLDMEASYFFSGLFR
ncbi:hypothetical protein EFB08_14025 [Rufibacter latericius]|uniref:Uncharacterized protein n=1 Tax=Rufibacter latericius TaxID=2487040 RepID=A0A3M9MKD7_9BACT|nr:hypothetical protein EFB08_14025 [Rufibacter latericius]